MADELDKRAEDLQQAVYLRGWAHKLCDDAYFAPGGCTGSTAVAMNEASCFLFAAAQRIEGAP
jgi:hypothetical protein